MHLSPARARRLVVSIVVAALSLHAAAVAVQVATGDDLQHPSAVVTLPSTQPAVARRPALTDEQLTSVAAELRAAYIKPPDQWPAPMVDEGVQFLELGLLPPVEHPESNPYSKAKAELGKQLFFDPRLSGSKQIACASCHDPDLAWADGRTVAFGHDRQVGNRNTPSILNSAYATSMFWDGRASSLESQARMPVINEIEMHATPDAVAERVNGIEGYRVQFKAVFGVDRVTFDEIASAIACFERTVVGGRSRFDAFLKGNQDALSDSAIRGLHLFRTTARCVNCHHGPNFSDNQFHNIGLTYYGRKFEDLGRFQATRRPEDVGKFKTPTLRNVTRTAPYMHNGFFELDGLLNLYNAGGPNVQPKDDAQRADPMFPIKSRLIKPLGLNKQDLADLTAFLHSLEEPKLRVRPPDLP